jgi:uncharacterized protein (DUF58 family)
MPTRKTFYWLVSAVFLYLIAWNVGSGWLYLLTTLLVGFPAASIILNRINIRRIELSQSAPPAATAGERLPVTMEIRNRSWLPRFFLDLEYEFGGSHRRLFLPALGPKESRRVILDFDDPRRGDYPGAKVRLSSAAPAGLARSWRRLDVTSPLVVYPCWHRLTGDWATGQKNAGYMVSSAIPTRNTASDYLGVRDYRPGDSPRSIHWRTSARSGNLAVIEYARQAAITPVFLVDTFAEADRGNDAASTFEAAVTIAASLVQREFRHNRRSGIGSSPDDAAARGLGDSAAEAMLWLARTQAKAKRPMDLTRASLPWPEVTPVLLLTSHPAYAELHRSEFLQNFPHSIVIMLDGRGFEKGGRPRFSLLDDAGLEKLAEQLESMGAEFRLIPSADEVPLCLTSL